MQRQVDLPAYAGLSMYLGDLHNHCDISYGHGSLEDAYANAALQLDFASVTGHASWHDMPRDDPRLAGATGGENVGGTHVVVHPGRPRRGPW